MQGLILAVALISVVCACQSTKAAEANPAPRVVESPLELAGREISVGFLIVDGVYNSELVAPMDIFQHTIYHVKPGMQVFTVGPSHEPVRTFEGLRILPDYTYTNAPPIDVLVVPSAEHSMDSDLEDEAMMSFVRQAGERASYVMSLCDGAFVLAAAGLLEELEATTFPADIARLREMFPGLVIREGVSFVHDGKAITSAGGAKSYDAALYLAEYLWGARVARGLAGGLVIDWDLERIAHVAP